MTDHNSPLTLFHYHGAVSPVETLGGILGADTATVLLWAGEEIFFIPHVYTYPSLHHGISDTALHYSKLQQGYDKWVTFITFKEW